ncbi:MAG: hypothetical protein ACM33B_14055 [Pseudomonadota bacterium]
MRAYAAATLVLSATMAALGVAMLVVTAVRGGGTIGFLLGALFLAAGVGRIWIQVRG